MEDRHTAAASDRQSQAGITSQYEWAGCILLMVPQPCIGGLMEERVGGSGLVVAGVWEDMRAGLREPSSFTLHEYKRNVLRHCANLKIYNTPTDLREL